jgi:hypothetical protein
MEKARNDKSKYISELQEKLKELTDNTKPEKKGLICIAYDKEASEDTQNAFLGAGFPADLAECLFGCMQQNETLANVVIAASNALVQKRMLAVQMQMRAQAPATTEDSKKTSKKKSKKLS